MNVFVVIIEWNDRPPSEWTGDPGLVGVYATLALAEAAQRQQQAAFDDQGIAVYQFSARPDRYCGTCGEELLDGSPHECSDHPDGEEDFCRWCGAETMATKSCDNDHDEWDIDVHIREMPVQGASDVPSPHAAEEAQDAGADGRHRDRDGHLSVRPEAADCVQHDEST